jgi:hypothetical protein
MSTGTPRARYGVCALVALALLAGCGSGSDGASTATTSSTNASNQRPSHFREYPGQEATQARVSRSDCEALAKTVGRQTGQAGLRLNLEPTPPNSRCEIAGGGVHVSLSLDTAYAAHQRYENRMVEQVQFNAPDPAKVPHHLPGVGDPSFDEHLASWIPAYSTLYAVRGNRWITLAYSVAGEPRSRREDQAAELARQAFMLTAR